ncbi:hypothetical protein TNCV_4094861 [Trichonephila clavipes]|uniref:Uncharacterized protein n=1 Tax=Trichonephila clavipes TaxID=2585209 RepID=A0A8X6S6X1_TRICX|nr:hypothetical protein TNCV_4094861 [Trichonephila clavipes]
MSGLGPQDGSHKGFQNHNITCPLRVLPSPLRDARGPGDTTVLCDHALWSTKIKSGLMEPQKGRTRKRIISSAVPISGKNAAVEEMKSWLSIQHDSANNGLLP